MKNITAIMQPYFFPYLGYFQLINASDIFILLDDVQYIRHGWVNRNRVLKPEGEWQYIIVPIKEISRDTLIRDVQIDESKDWKGLILRQMAHYKKKAPFYKETIDLVDECFQINQNSLSLFNFETVKLISAYLEIKTNMLVSSQMDLDYSSISVAGEWGLEICHQLEAEQYINPIGGKALFDPIKFQQKGIDLKFHLIDDIKYKVGWKNNFVPNLSIIDVLMFNSLEKVNEMLHDFKLL
ncbi:WbqC-like protein family protein [Aquiflexum balticum DSM 16537]|uniref:WbqC-like protein family protein n=1 Tax=Aquiflexum balticum DSM 16537 TaxID=758820 RepID=A0A1W2HAZ2_9BACT|nr:WbqC family protein [Aquiflexum balticum]SMD46060.1 WbqC-like protein family protein [Aquiflexum balticum DSM 16537]